jgi:hypothetical protein
LTRRDRSSCPGARSPSPSAIFAGRISLQAEGRFQTFANRAVAGRPDGLCARGQRRGQSVHAGHSETGGAAASTCGVLCKCGGAARPSAKRAIWRISRCGSAYLERAALCYGTPRPDDVIDWLLTVHYERLRVRKAPCMLTWAMRRQTVGEDTRYTLHGLHVDAPTEPTLHCRSDVLCVESERSETQRFRESEVIVEDVTR